MFKSLVIDDLFESKTSFSWFHFFILLWNCEFSLLIKFLQIVVVFVVLVGENKIIVLLYQFNYNYTPLLHERRSTSQDIK